MKAICALILMFMAIAPLQMQQPAVNEPRKNDSPGREDNQVCVLGAVNKQTAVMWHEGLTVLQALKEVDGLFTHKTSVRVHRKISDKPREFLVIKIADLRKVENGKADDVNLQPNDILEVVPLETKWRKKVSLPRCPPCGFWLLGWLKNRYM